MLNLKTYRKNSWWRGSGEKKKRTRPVYGILFSLETDLKFHRGLEFERLDHRAHYSSRSFVRSFVRLVRRATSRITRTELSPRSLISSFPSHIFPVSLFLPIPLPSPYSLPPNPPPSHLELAKIRLNPMIYAKFRRAMSRGKLRLRAPKNERILWVLLLEPHRSLT